MIARRSLTVAALIGMETKSNNTNGQARLHLLDLDREALLAAFAEKGAPSFRAQQILQWVYERGVTSFEQMTNLSKLLREQLASEFDLYQSEIIRRAVSSDGTIKLLLRWPDGATSECVMIPSETRRTACVSSQVGCPAGCRFCASGLGGWNGT
jgi:23S rRNA (adenine2503-C2)-methyltransferase